MCCLVGVSTVSVTVHFLLFRDGFAGMVAAAPLRSRKRDSGGTATRDEGPCFSQVVCVPSAQSKCISYFQLALKLWPALVEPDGRSMCLAEGTAAEYPRSPVLFLSH